MLTAIFVFLVFGVALAVVLWVGTAAIQGYLYTESPPDLYWRAPAAALAISLFAAFWCLLAHRHPGTIRTLFEFGASPNDRFTDLVWVRPDPKDEQSFIEVRRFTYNPGKRKYLDGIGRPWSRSSSDSIVEWMRAERKEDDKPVSVVFRAELNPDGTFKEPTTYVELNGKGRVMTEDDLGAVSASRGGVVFVNLFLNAAFFGAWFLCLWLLLRFQWLHALGLALPLWAALVLAIMPILFMNSTG